MSTNKLAESIIEIMKVCGLSSNDALEIIHELSKPPLSIDEDECDEVKSYRKIRASKIQASAPIDEAVQESGIDDVMQDVYTSGAEEKVTFHDELIAQLHKRLDCKNNKDDLTLYRSIKYALEAAKEFKGERDQLKSELRDIERYVFKFFDGSYTSVEYERLPHTSEEFNVIVKRLMELSGWAKKEEYTSGEDPGDENEIIVPLTPAKNNVFAGSEEKEELLTINERNDKIREYQRTTFGEMNITFKDGDEYICSLDIHDVLERCMYVLRGQHIILPYKLKNTVRRYEIVESVPKKFPSHELLIQVKEIKAYD